ncbi:MAG: hypothetical protein KJO07_07965 [Deltaproteobacteria bacterium]|nr:hypothetical protein [Deltaproteobacteria bacterium]
MRIGWLLIAFIACSCGRDDGKGSSAKAASAAPAPPADAALPVAELRGRRLCSQVAPPHRLVSATGVEELIMAAGFSKTEDGRLTCLYLWPAKGPPEVTIDVRLDCRELRPSTNDLAAHWPEAGREGDRLTRDPAAGVHQHFRDLQEPACHLTITTGFLVDDRTAAIADVVASRVDARLALGLARAE